MDISEIGIVISVISVSIAVLKQSWDGKKNNKNSNCDKLKDYVPREVCHLAMKNLEDRIGEVKGDTQEIKTILNNEYKKD